MGLRESIRAHCGSGGRERDGWREVVEIYKRHGNWERTWENEG